MRPLKVTSINLYLKKPFQNLKRNYVTFAPWSHSVKRAELRSQLLLSYSNYLKYRNMQHCKNVTLSFPCDSYFCFCFEQFVPS